MADTVASKVIKNDGHEYVVALTNHSDATGEADVVKIDKSGLVYWRTGAEPQTLDIVDLEWSIDGMTVTLEWDRATDQAIFVMAGTGCYHGCKHGAISEPAPHTAATTGDILLTTSGAAAGDTYWILIRARLR